VVYYRLFACWARRSEIVRWGFKEEGKVIEPRTPSQKSGPNCHCPQRTMVVECNWASGMKKNSDHTLSKLHIWTYMTDKIFTVTGLFGDLWLHGPLSGSTRTAWNNNRLRNCSVLYCGITDESVRCRGGWRCGMLPNYLGRLCCSVQLYGDVERWLQHVSQSEFASVDHCKVQLSVVSEWLSITGHVPWLRPWHLSTTRHWYGTLYFHVYWSFCTKTVWVL